MFCINAGTKAVGNSRDCLNCKRANPDDAAKTHDVRICLLNAFFFFLAEKPD